MSEINNPVSAVSEHNTARPDLRMVYRIMIRAYMRQQMRQNPRAGEEVPRG